MRVIMQTHKYSHIIVERADFIFIMLRFFKKYGYNVIFFIFILLILLFMYLFIYF